MKDLMTNRTDERFSAEIRNGRALLDLARGWLAQGNPVVAIELLRSATGSEEAECDQALKAGIFKETGRAMMMQSDWDSAEPYYLGAQRLYREIGDVKGAAECARNRANMYFQRGRYQDSQHYSITSCSSAHNKIQSDNIRAPVLTVNSRPGKGLSGYLSRLAPANYCRGSLPMPVGKSCAGPAFRVGSNR